jgi:WD40 repeat protein/DNA-binding SARP family transcriptional activator
MAHYRLSLLGAFELQVGGAAAGEFSTAKATALLAYLALNSHTERNQSQHRQTLAALLWPEIDKRYALHSLRNTLHRLQRTLQSVVHPKDPPLLHVTRQAIALNAGAVSVDVTEFQTLLASTASHAHERVDTCRACRERLAQAVKLYRGELLAGFSLADAPAFEEWLLLRRELIHHQVLEATATLADIYEANNAQADAQRTVYRLLELDAFREESHRQLMRLHAKQQAPHLALAQYEKMRQLFQMELNAEPGPETVALVQQITDGKFDKTTRRQESALSLPQDDEVTQTDSTIQSPPYPVRPAPSRRATKSPLHDLRNVPDPGPFFGRMAERQQIAQWLLHDRCRMVAILGIGGVGKTSLAAFCVRELVGEAGSNPFEVVLWRSLLNAPPLTALLPPLLQILSDQQLTPMPESVDEQLRLLLSYLLERRVLLVLDNMESILEPERAGAYRPGYEPYGQLIQQVATLNHQSQLLLTSRERPHGYARLEKDSFEIHSLQLAGLDADASHQLLVQRGLHSDNGEATMLIARYSGNPLALKLVADTVDELFGGDIAELLREETLVFDDIRTVLDQQFARLTALEQQILFWLAVEREPTSPQTLRQNLLRPPAQRAFLEALRGLQRRSLLERQGNDFVLQNVVTEYLTERLVEFATAEIESGTFNRLQQHALLKAQAKDYVRASQMRLILHPVGEKLVDRIGLIGLRTKLQQILSDLRIGTPQAAHYAGGNLLNLLLALEIDVRGYDFSNLSIWQAYLQNAELPDVNFSGVHFANTLFIDRFGAITALALDPQNTYLASAANGDPLIRLWRLHDGQLMMTLAGHAQTCTALDFHPAGHLLASGSVDRTIRLWDVESGRAVATLQGHDSQIENVAFSPNGELLASGGPGEDVCIWAVETGQLLATLPPHQGFLRPIVFHPDGQTLGTKSSLDIYFWSLQELYAQIHSDRKEKIGVPRTRTVCPPDMAALCFDFSPDGSQLAIGTEAGPVFLWDIAQERLSQPLIGHTVPVIEVAFSPDGQLLISSSRDGTVRLWDVATGKPLDILHGHLGAVWAIRISTDGETLASGGADGVIRIWELRSTGQRRILRTFRGDLREIKGIAISAQGSIPNQIILAACSKNGRCHLWQLNQQWDQQFGANVDKRSTDNLNGVYLHGLRGHAGSINCIAFRSHSAELATAGDDHTVRIWDIARNQCLAILREHVADVRALTYSSQGSVLASAAGDGIIHVWIVDDWGHYQLQQTIQESRASEVLAISADEKTLIYSLVNNTIVLWDIEQGETLQRATDATAAAWALELDAAERRMVTGHLDGTINLWEMADRRLVTPPRTLGHHKQAIIHSIRFNPAGDLVVSGGFDSMLYVWDPATGEVLHQLDVFNDGINDVTFLPNSNILLAACLDGAVRIWNVETGTLLDTLNVPGPYEGMNITGVTGITEAQKEALKALGAVEAG